MMQGENEMGGHVVAEHRLRNLTAIRCERPLHSAVQAGAEPDGTRTSLEGAFYHDS